jgi:hypothetical protein
MLGYWLEAVVTCLSLNFSHERGFDGHPKLILRCVSMDKQIYQQTMTTKQNKNEYKV